MAPLAGKMGGQTIAATNPPEYLYTGVMDIRGYGTGGTLGLTNLADVTPGIVRLRAEQGNSLGNYHGGAADPNHVTTLARSGDILESGAQLLPCLDTDGWASKADFTNYLTSWIQGLDANAENPPIWYEIGNEPDTGGSTQTVEGRAAIRAKYLDYMTDASVVLDSYGKKLIMTAVTGTAGGTTNMLDDIQGGTAGATFSMIDGFAIHPYTVYATTQQNNVGTYDSVVGYRTLFDGAPYSQSAKPLWITELGWSCATRAGGGGAADWNGEPPEMLQTNISITEAQQASRIQSAVTDLVAHRNKTGTGHLYLRAIVIFAYCDYAIPGENWDKHCGLVDWSGRARSSYTTVKNLQRQYLIGA